MRTSRCLRGNIAGHRNNLGFALGYPGIDFLFESAKFTFDTFEDLYFLASSAVSVG
jgi:hypothetical protein